MIFHLNVSVTAAESTAAVRVKVRVHLATAQIFWTLLAVWLC